MSDLLAYLIVGVAGFCVGWFISWMGGKRTRRAAELAFRRGWTKGSGWAQDAERMGLRADGITVIGEHYFDVAEREFQEGQRRSRSGGAKTPAETPGTVAYFDAEFQEGRKREP